MHGLQPRKYKILETRNTLLQSMGRQDQGGGVTLKTSTASSCICGSATTAPRRVPAPASAESRPSLQHSTPKIWGTDKIHDAFRHLRSCRNSIITSTLCSTTRSDTYFGGITVNTRAAQPQRLPPMICDTRTATICWCVRFSRSCDTTPTTSTASIAHQCPRPLADHNNTLTSSVQCIGVIWRR